mmetsp:Transcript_25480/g.73695  ORF Transcript_25480/g.73695 Transcript_25480/m.73695 type:complete len:204 (-) Transcript_25480:846-1457(-)
MHACGHSAVSSVDPSPPRLSHPSSVAPGPRRSAPSQSLDIPRLHPHFAPPPRPLPIPSQPPGCPTRPPLLHPLFLPSQHHPPEFHPLRLAPPRRHHPVCRIERRPPHPQLRRYHPCLLHLLRQHLVSLRQFPVYPPLPPQLNSNRADTHRIAGPDRPSMHCYPPPRLTRKSSTCGRCKHFRTVFDLPKSPTTFWCRGHRDRWV